MEFRRPATKEEIRIYNIVNEFMNKLDDDEYSTLVEKISDYVFEWRKIERRQAYSKLYKTAVKIGVCVSDLETWYCMDD